MTLRIQLAVWEGPVELFKITKQKSNCKLHNVSRREGCVSTSLGVKLGEWSAPLGNSAVVLVLAQKSLNLAVKL